MQQLSCVHAAGEEPHIVVHHIQQDFLSALVNESHIVEIDDAPGVPARCFIQFSHSSETHGPVSRPCKTHFCSVGVSVIEIFSMLAFLCTIQSLHLPCQPESDSPWPQLFD